MAKKKSTKKTFLKPQEWKSQSDRWAHILGFLYENRKRICSAGFNNEVVFQLGGETITIKGR